MPMPDADANANADADMTMPRFPNGRLIKISRVLRRSYLIYKKNLQNGTVKRKVNKWICSERNLMIQEFH